MRAGVELAIEHSSATRWASVTFTGARHEVRLSVAGDAGRQWIAGLPEADLPMRGHLVADVAVIAVAQDGERISATIEALTVEER